MSSVAAEPQIGGEPGQHFHRACYPDSALDKDAKKDVASGRAAT